jgi:branched-chain amino acid aminotransferase
MSMSDRDGKIWMDGQMVDWRDAKIHVLSHTLHYGCGAFEGVRAYNTAHGTAIFRLQRAHRAPVQQRQDPAHEDPLHPGAGDAGAVRRGAREQARELLPAPADLDRLQKLGVSPKGNTIHLMVAAWPWGAYLGEEGLKRGIRVKTSSYTRHHVNITMTQAKAVSNYTNSILANMEATDEGYDEALLLDSPASSAKARARTCSSSRRAWSTRPTCRPARSTASPATPSSHICQGPGPEAGGKAHHPRRGLHLRRGLLHRHRRRSDADPRARPHRTRRRQRGPITEKIQSGLLRHRQRPQPEVRRVADQGLTP